MPIPHPAELLAFLQGQGFLTLPQVQQMSGAVQSGDARALGRELVARNWLTAFQANQLLAGRGTDLLLGPYRISDRLGEGGMGQVFKAYHTAMDRVVALKVIAKDRVSNPTAVARFNREVRAVAKLSHPNIVLAFEAGLDGATYFLAMEYVEGIDLAKLVHQSGPLPVARACEYVRQAAFGLQHAHEKGLVHRDIKPGNLIVMRPSPDAPPVIKILDFGLARFESESDHAGRLTQLGNLVGTVDFIAPEQAHNSRTADIRADIYSLGCTLVYLLTGKAPFHGADTVERIGARVVGNIPPIRESRPEVSPHLESVVSKMMARKPLERYQTPGEVAKALEPHAQDTKPARRANPTIVDTASAPPPALVADRIPQAVVLPPVRTASPSWQPAGEGEQRRNAHVAVWFGLGGAAALGLVAFLAILGGAIYLIANKGADDSKKNGSPAEVVQRKPDEAAPKLKDGRDENGIGRPQKGKDADDGGRPPAERDLPKSLFVDVGAGVEMEFVLIPKGKFTMGSPSGETGRNPWERNYDAEEQHEVEITKSFYLGKYPVTQEQYAAITGKKIPLKFPPSVVALDQGLLAPRQFPVDDVSKADAKACCAKMTNNDKRSRKFGLPTEAEWEYACRAGTRTAYYFGDDPKMLGDYAWFEGNSGGNTHEVGTRRPNPWGLYDMIGNVRQWCEDCYGPCQGLGAKDPVRLGGSWHVLRGGSALYTAQNCRAACRSWDAPNYRKDGGVGFRMCFRVE
jgi:serine/threonine-protein kinase